MNYASAPGNIFNICHVSESFCHKLICTKQPGSSTFGIVEQVQWTPVNAWLSHLHAYLVTNFANTKW